MERALISPRDPVARERDVRARGVVKTFAEASEEDSAEALAFPSVLPAFSHRHLLGIKDLAAQDIQAILDRADEHISKQAHLERRSNALRGVTLINVFMENSTRTRISFELAAKRLGAEVTGISVAHSSIRKGETLLDTAMTLRAMSADLLVVRHPHSGAVKLLSEKVGCSVVNAGDGFHEHPTQALLDAATIRNRKGRLQGLRVAICGDIRHSRVARSNILLLQKMGAHPRIVAPPTLLPDQPDLYGVEVFTDMRRGLEGCDIVMMLRLQVERMQGRFVPSTREYFHFFGLDEEKLKYARPDALIMHPGPVNRGVEIDSALADDLGRTLIHDQVEMGVAVRMSCLELLRSNLDRSNRLQRASPLLSQKALQKRSVV